MIGYLTLGTNDMEKARSFYDALLAEVGAKRIVEDGDRLTLWGNSPKAPMMGVIKPHNGEPATAGNGTMPAIAVKDTEQLKRVYEKALELGAEDEGAPGPRGNSGHFAYFRDLEGQKLAVFCMG